MELFYVNAETILEPCLGCSTSRLTRARSLSRLKQISLRYMSKETKQNLNKFPTYLSFSEL